MCYKVPKARMVIHLWGANLDSNEFHLGFGPIAIYNTQCLIVAEVAAEH